MEKNILSKVVEVEREIQQRIEAEEINAKEWIEKVKKEVGDGIAREEAGLKEAFNIALKEARTVAERKASEIMSEVFSLEERLKAISDETLKEIIMRHITNILPAK